MGRQGRISDDEMANQFQFALLNIHVGSSQQTYIPTHKSYTYFLNITDNT